MRLTRLALATLVALMIAAPASAQFGGLKKKIKEKTGQDKTTSAETAAPGGQGGTIVLTTEVVNQLLTGLKAGEAERAAASKEDTPYGRYQKAEAAYAVAQPKCEAAQQTFPTRAAANPKMLDKYSALTNKMVAAQQKQDQKLAAVYYDSAMAMQDPSCIVKKPDQPQDLYQSQRDLDTRAEKAEVKASGMSAGDLAMVKERATAILAGSTPPGDASPMETSAVSAKSAELKPLLGIQDQTTARATKTAPAPQAAAEPAPATPQVDPARAATAQSMGDCMTKNMRSHQAEMQALGQRAQEAQAANDQAKLMAIADTVQRLQTAGCTGR